MKTAIIGAGKVGEIIAFGLVNQEIGNEVLLLDIVQGLPDGKALDIFQTTPILRSSMKVVGSDDPSMLAGADIVVVPAGVPRKPGMDRMDLLKVNLKICRSVINNITQYAPDAMIIYVANPVDVMTYVAKELSGFPENRVFGMAGVLDTARYRTFISMEANVAQEDVSAMVLGGHGNSMVPLPRYTTIGGIPVSHFLDKATIDRIVERTRKGGGEIVKLLGYSGYYAPGLATVEMIESIVRDQRRLLPTVAYLTGQYGFTDIYAGVPVILGKNGVEEILEISLDTAEKQALNISFNSVKAGIDEMKAFLV